MLAAVLEAHGPFILMARPRMLGHRGHIDGVRDRSQIADPSRRQPAMTTQT